MAFVGAFVAYVAVFARNKTPSVAVTVDGDGNATLVLQTVGTVGHGHHGDWPSYLVQRPNGTWVQATTFTLPANSTVHVKVLEYDTQTGLRNNFFALPQGLVGGKLTIDDGTNSETVSSVDPALVAHTLTIPGMGISVPLVGVANNAPNQCSTAPCEESSTHQTIEFTIRTGKKGHFRWQCIVPCAPPGFVYGNGGPMQTVGYMGGYVDVV
ncbi:MAG: hypothetical protein ACKO2C_04300 [Actinomycetes bacterium]